ncbi:copper resistance protein CopC [Kineococcus sp. TBRC 1896]|uniref:Copper resistance protein CopC n=1 Tax=Kineococcus mangrovi TaxID=1660183 RepID=A0ABV4I3F7_9ACTN
MTSTSTSSPTPTPTPTPAPRTAVAVAAGVLSCLVWALATAVPATAHDQLRSTNPADGASLEQVPAQLEMTYSSQILPIAPLAVLRDGAGNDIPTADPVVDGDTLTVAWPDGLGGGDYQVVWRVVSGDGHPVQGAFGFTVAGAPSTPAAPGATAAPAPTPAPASQGTRAAPAPADATSSGGFPGAPVAAVVLVLVLVGLVPLALHRRRRAKGPQR